ncbi:MAG: DNA-3-methyladenine glycosylase [Candidatus Bathyarchaeia archaeon]
MSGKAPLPKSFYTRDPKIVAIDLLGKILVRRLDDNYLEGIIVETEAYYGANDPASRARNGMKRYNAPMWGEVGLAFIYNVHNNWMLNVVAHEQGSVGAVLVRAIEPLRGIDIMMANRKIYDDIINLTNGPGKLTRALKIDGKLNRVDLANNGSPIFISHGENLGWRRIWQSRRVGVKKDLDMRLRFYVGDSSFVSKRFRSDLPVDFNAVRLNVNSD